MLNIYKFEYTNIYVEKLKPILMKGISKPVQIYTVNTTIYKDV